MRIKISLSADTPVDKLKKAAITETAKTKELPKAIQTAPSKDSKVSEVKTKPVAKKIEIPLSEQRYLRNKEDIPNMKKHVSDGPVRDDKKNPRLITEKEIRERFRQHYGDTDPRALMDRVVKDQEDVAKRFKRGPNAENYVRKTGLRMMLDTDYGAGENHSPETVYKDVYHEAGITS